MAGTVGGTVLGSASGLVGDPTPRLHRDGNVMRDPSDNLVALHGLNVVDPRRANANAPWTKPIDELVKLATNPDQGWNAQVIRLPVHPIDIHDPTGDYGKLAPGKFSQAELEKYLENHLDTAVQACKDRGVYAIVDYHRHRNKDFTDPALDEEVRMFWKTVAPRYADQSHVLYEMYNEPVGTDRGGFRTSGAEDCYNRWKETAQPWLDIIQERAPSTPVIVGTPSWDQYTYLVPGNEFDGENLMYAGHIYAHEFARPLADSFGAPSEEVPVFMTEWGFDTTGSSASYITGTVDDEGQEFKSFFQEYDHISSTAWIMSHFWSPTMYVAQDGGSNYEKLTAFGSFTQDFLASKVDVHRPGPVEMTTTETPTETTTTKTTTTPEEPTWPTDPPATDPDGDGLYEDLSGDGTVNFPDVNTLFQNSDTANVQTNAKFYDFEDSGTINLQDVMALFHLV